VDSLQLKLQKIEEKNQKMGQIAALGDSLLGVGASLGLGAGAGGAGGGLLSALGGGGGINVPPAGQPTQLGQRIVQPSAPAVAPAAGFAEQQFQVAPVTTQPQIFPQPTFQAPANVPATQTRRFRQRQRGGLLQQGFAIL